jgi:hypothetical protein
MSNSGNGGNILIWGGGPGDVSPFPRPQKVKTVCRLLKDMDVMGVMHRRGKIFIADEETDTHYYWTIGFGCSLDLTKGVDVEKV